MDTDAINNFGAEGNLRLYPVVERLTGSLSCTFFARENLGENHDDEKVIAMALLENYY